MLVFQRSQNLAFNSLLFFFRYVMGREFGKIDGRVNNFNFDAGILTIHDGKGKKDRTLPIPEVLVTELKNHLKWVYNLHQMDLADNYDGAFMFDRFEKKYKGAGKEFIWQWFFPA